MYEKLYAEIAAKLGDEGCCVLGRFRYNVNAVHISAERGDGCFQYYVDRLEGFLDCLFEMGAIHKYGDIYALLNELRALVRGGGSRV